MMKTGLSIIQSFMRRINLTAPTTIAGTTDVGELQLENLLYAVCEELRQVRIWPQQKREHSFNTVSGTRTYQLPIDFYSALPETQWNTTDDCPLIGPISDMSMAVKEYGGLSSGTTYSYRIFGPDENPESTGGQFYLDPEPSSSDNIKFPYISRRLFLPQFWEASTAYTSGDYCFVNNGIYKCDMTGTSGSTPPTGADTNITDGSTRWDYVSTANSHTLDEIRYETIVDDSDICIFDYDLVTLGLMAKWSEQKGGEFEKAEYDYKNRIDQAVARYKGAYFGSMIGNYSGPRYSVEHKSWSI